MTVSSCVMYCLLLGPYRTLGLHCERSRRYVSNKSDGIVPEAQRNRNSKRMECPFRVTINWPNDYPAPYISSAVARHNHELYENFDARYMETKLKPDEIALVENLSIVSNTSRTQLHEVRMLLIHTDFGRSCKASTKIESTTPRKYRTS